MTSKLHKAKLVAVALLTLNVASTYAKDGSEPSEKLLDQSKSRVFIYRTSSSLLLGGVSASYGGRKIASLSNKEFDVAEIPVGEVEIEVGQNLSADLCRVKVVIDSGKDNFLKIRDRDVGVARRFIFNSPVIQLLDRGTSGACGGLNEIIKVEAHEGAEESANYEYSPLRDLADKSLEQSALCGALKAESANKCKINHRQISAIRPVKYVQVASKSQEIQQISQSGDLVKCQVEANPVIEVEVKACLTIKGKIIDAESYSCVIAANPPIKLVPELCIQGGGKLVR